VKMQPASAQAAADGGDGGGGSDVAAAPAAPARLATAPRTLAERARVAAASAAERAECEARFAAASTAAAAAAAASAPFRGPAADSSLGERFLDIIALVCAHGHGLDLHHARFICGLTLREGIRRADGSLDRAGFLGGAADVIRSAARLQGLDSMRAEESRGGSRRTQLMRAALNGNEKRVRELVAAGAKLDLVHGGGWSALHYASDRGHARIVKLLLDGKYEGKGACTNLHYNGSWTALIRASVNGHEAVARLLLERGADVTLRDSDGRTALYWARFRNHAAVVALLEAHGAPE
jgi:hypothetical protein